MATAYISLMNTKSIMENNNYSLNILGRNYLEAVKLEQNSGKEPRLFCNKSVVEQINNKKIVRVVDKEKDVYEIVWTIIGCEAVTYSMTDKWQNVKDNINSMLLPAISLYLFYCNNLVLKKQYEELLNLVCCGIVKYAKDECDNRENDAIALINKALQYRQIAPIDATILSDFIA